MARISRVAHALFIYTLLFASLSLADHSIRGLNHHHRYLRLQDSNATSSAPTLTSNQPASTALALNTSSAAPTSQSLPRSMQASSPAVSSASRTAVTASPSSGPTSSLLSSPSAPSPSAPSQTLSPGDIHDLDVISQRRITNIINALSAPANISAW